MDNGDPGVRSLDDVPNLTTTSVIDNSITYSFTGKAPSIKTGNVLVSGEENGYLTTLTLNFSAMKAGTGGRIMKLADGVSITE